MNSHVEAAVSLYNKGFNCAQSSFGAYSEEIQLDPNQAAKLSSSFGGGFGKLGEVCGAFSGICMAAGMIYGYDDPTDKLAKDQHYELVRELGKRFTLVNGSLLCRDLLESNKARPVLFSSDGVKVKECEHIVRSVVQLLDDVIREKNAKLKQTI